MKKTPYGMFLIPAAALVITIAIAIGDAKPVSAENPPDLAHYWHDTTVVEEIPVETVKPLKRAKIEVTEDVALEATTIIEMTVSETETEAEPEPVLNVPYYCYKNRDYLDHSIQYHLYDLWTRYGMPEDWYIYMIGLIYQECGFKSTSVHQNADGSRDIGYFQYNTRWFAGTAAKYGASYLDINNNYHQAYLFVLQMRDRRTRGLSLEQCLSCHRRGDYDAYDAEYVAMVKDRTASLIREN